MRTSRLLICGAAVVAIALTGCSKTDSPATTDSAGGTTSAGSAQPGKKAGFDSLKSLSDAVAKKSDVKNTAHMTMSGSAAGQDIKAEGDYKFGGADTAMRMTMDTPEGEITMLMVDKILYFKMPQELQPGKPWLKLDLNDKDNPLAAGLGGAMDSMEETDPRKTLAELAKSGDIKSTEEAELNGKKTTHYTIVVDIKKMAEAQPNADSKKALEEAEKAGMSTFPVEVWIDEEDLPVRMIMAMPTPGIGGKVTESKFTVDYTDWGKPVDIAAPPAAQVAEFPGS